MEETGAHNPERYLGVRTERALLPRSASHSASEEVPVNLNKWVRQIHRWLSIVFTITVIANFVVRARGTPPDWVTYSPLLPLALLLFTGLYLFVLPYATKWRSGQRID